MKRLVLDIETSPILAYSWGLWNQNIGINQIKRPSRMISVAAKWYGEKKVYFWSDFHSGHRAMVEGIYNLIGDADAVIHYNGERFDMKHLRREFLQFDLGPEKPVANIDLLRAIKSKIDLPSYKLEYVASVLLGLDGKLQHTGFTMWAQCLDALAELEKPEDQRDEDVVKAGEKAWSLMRRYNIQDVRVTEQVYDRIRPWMHNHPSWALHAEDVNPDTIRCPNCGSEDFQRRGFKATLQSTYQQYRCNSCGAWYRGTKAMNRVHLRGNA
ncbi:MAG: ribonuclease H-like domain-containing protein [Acidobacterium ailaaui]|nr:ribonuclease H-like domain-containing protein [Pseudacidobacterium ailaaui]